MDRFYCLHIGITFRHVSNSNRNKFLQNDGTVYEVHYIRKMYRKTLEIMKVSLMEFEIVHE